MNAIQFIQQRNIDEVREVLSMMPNFLVTHMTDDARMFIDANNPLLDEFQRSQIKGLICIDELKRLVESVELIENFVTFRFKESHNGLIMAKKALENIINNHADSKYAMNFEKPALEQAIADYEAIGGEHV
ncbi:MULTISPECIES: hypothetical protein [unclassified Acinetobacter]|uniref:hypothetical protein n=1 Tax=unclassified Acinetobacter TaxID=196816 RepID=UPI001F4A88EC|nr:MULTISPECIES: hypothetical protein [unclassified Acinetobacter]MCH7353294.1 hypothetical protein [Acinetobacter sp. NIPH 2023]MCH7360676.1 hypothetical protein [Acinetobacter sp. NIPH 2024]